MNAYSAIRQLTVGASPQGIERHFSSNDDVTRMQVLLALTQEGGCSRTCRDELDRLFGTVLRAVARGDLLLNYEPECDGTITLPPLGDPQYLRAALYWTVEFKAPFERVTEACRRSGANASRAAIFKTIKQIELEDRMCQTDAFFMARAD